MGESEGNIGGVMASPEGEAKNGGERGRNRKTPFPLHKSHSFSAGAINPKGGKVVVYNVLV